MPQPESLSDDCLAGGGEMGALMRSIDWAKTPIGPVATWRTPTAAAPDSLRRERRGGDPVHRLASLLRADGPQRDGPGPVHPPLPHREQSVDGLARVTGASNIMPENCFGGRRRSALRSSLAGRAAGQVGRRRRHRLRRATRGKRHLPSCTVR